MKPAYQLFNITLSRYKDISPSMRRFTFVGDEVKQMVTMAPDQRVKLFFPTIKGEAPSLENHPDWLDLYRAMPDDERPPMRTYTIRYLRADQGEVDVDFVLHGDNGPASRWALQAQAGEKLQIIAPNQFVDEKISGGFEWKPPKDVKQVLLMADETALPALHGILEALSEQDTPPKTQVFIEVPLSADCIDLPKWKGLEVNWLPRDTQESKIQAGVLLGQSIKKIEIPDIEKYNGQLKQEEGEGELLWDSANSVHTEFYAWVAGESAAVRGIRQFLTKEAGLDHSMLNLMAYWRMGVKGK